MKKIITNIKRNNKTIVFTLLFMLFGFSAIAGNKTVKIKTSAVCGMCKDRIESSLNKIDGSKKTMLIVETGVLLVKYNTKKLSEMDIKIAISDLGYSADDLPKNEIAYNNLPACCQKTGSCSSNDGHDY